MISPSFILIFFGIVFIEANPYAAPSADVAEDQKSTTNESGTLDALKVIRALLFHDAADKSVPEQPMPQYERTDAMRTYITETSEKLGRLIKDVTQFGMSMINSSTKMALAILNVTTTVMADDADQIRPMLRDIASDLEDLKPQYYELRNSDPEPEHIDEQNPLDVKIVRKIYPKKFHA
uniref:Uncharacterized protein n=1 Tax=Meteorus pulchricornis TaxID=51522 RepID=H7CHJ6_9HYME|nr:hypothetical protein [Meteorus pulchricornis]